jgi:hypothetical protein
MCLFHKWSKWEQYIWQGVVYPGRLAPKEIQGKAIETTEKWQRRQCQKCGYLQEKEVNGY